MKHGRAMYARGCRCEVCKASRAAANRRYRAGVRAPAPPACLVCGAELVQKRGAPRLYCSGNCERLARLPRCACGERMSREAKRCMACQARAREDRAMRERVARLWAEGLTLRELAAAMGWSSWKVAGTRVHELRARGVDLPYRRPAEERARIRAGIVAALSERRAA